MLISPYRGRGNAIPGWMIDVLQQMTLLLPLPSLLRTHNDETSECRSLATVRRLTEVSATPTYMELVGRDKGVALFHLICGIDISSLVCTLYVTHCNASYLLPPPHWRCVTSALLIYVLLNYYYMNPFIFTTLVSLLMCRAVHILILSTMHLPLPSLLRTRDGETSEYLMCTWL